MSSLVASQVWKVCARNGLKGSKLMIMARLADFADESYSCFPSITTISEETGLGRSTVTTSIRELETEGWIIRKHRKVEGTKKNRSNRYFLNGERLQNLVRIHDLEKRKSRSSESDLMVQSGDFSGSEFDITVVQKLNHLDSSESEPDPSLDPSLDPSQEYIGEKPKKSKLDFSPLGLTDEQIAEWKDLRKRANTPVTQRVINSIAKEFDKSRQAGFTNDQILDLLSEKGWKGYKHEWMLNANQAMGAQAHGTQQRTKEHNGIGYGEHADQSIFPNYLQIATNDMPDIKATREAAQLTYLKTYGTQVLGSDGAALRASLENDEWK